VIFGRAATAARRTFRSMSVRNYRLYMTGQVISMIGTWMQSVAQAWLVLKLGQSGTALGLVAAAQFLPVLLLSPWGGLLADRFDKRRILLATQAGLGVLAVLLGVLTVTHSVRLWMVYCVAAGFGVMNAGDNPARQTFVMEMVGPEDVSNAVTLNSVTMNLARIVGPAIAAVVIATLGTGVCFLVNGVSYVAVLIALLRMDGSLLYTVPAQERRKGQLREGYAYVRRTPEVLSPLLLMAVVSLSDSGIQRPDAPSSSARARSAAWSRAKQTVTVWPAPASWRAMLAPMRPAPTIAILIARPPRGSSARLPRRSSSAGR